MSKNKKWLTQSVSEWQGHLLSCQVTAKNNKLSSRAYWCFYYRYDDLVASHSAAMAKLEHCQVTCRSNNCKDSLESAFRSNNPNKLEHSSQLAFKFYKWEFKEEGHLARYHNQGKKGMWEPVGDRPVGKYVWSLLSHRRDTKANAVVWLSMRSGNERTGLILKNLYPNIFFCGHFFLSFWGMWWQIFMIVIVMMVTDFFIVVVMMMVTMTKFHASPMIWWI